MSATASTDGVSSPTCRHRDRMVGSTSSSEGAHSSHTVLGAGSSTAFNTAFADFSFNRSASSTRITCQRPVAERRERLPHRVPHVIGEDLRAHRRHRADIRVRPHERRMTPVTEPASRAPPERPVGTHALQRRRERPRRRRPPRPRRPGEQPRMRHLRRLRRRDPLLRRRDDPVRVPSGRVKLPDQPLLPHQVVPHGHAAPPPSHKASRSPIVRAPTDNQPRPVPPGPTRPASLPATPGPPRTGENGSQGGWGTRNAVKAWTKGDVEGTTVPLTGAPRGAAAPSRASPMARLRLPAAEYRKRPDGA